MLTAGILIDQSKCASKTNIEPTTLLPTVRGPVLLARLHIIWPLTQLVLVPTNNCGFLRLRSSFLLFCHLSLMVLRVGVILPLTLSLFSSPLSHPLPHSASARPFQLPSKNQQRYLVAKRVPFTPVLSSSLPPLSTPLPPPIFPSLRCGSDKMLIWRCTRSALPKPPPYLPLSPLLRLVIYCWHALWY